MEITLHQAKPLIKKCLRSKLVPYIQSSPAIGKSSIYKEIADEAKLCIIDWRGSAADPTDLNGFPDLEGNFATYKPFDTFPTKDTPVPVGYKGWLLILDELSSVSHSVQKALYKLILDRMVGQHHLHDKVFMCAAGNLETDNALVGSLSTALISRMVHMFIKPDLDSFVNWGYKHGVASKILSFVTWKTKCFYTFDPDMESAVYASPRTWEMLSKIEKTTGTFTDTDLPLVAGTIGKGNAIEYLSYLKLFNELPKLDEIQATPLTYPIPTDRLDLLNCLATEIGEKMTLKNCSTFCQYIKRMPKEFTLLTLRTAFMFNKKLAGDDDFNELVDEYIEYLS